MFTTALDKHRCALDVLTMLSRSNVKTQADGSADCSVRTVFIVDDDDVLVEALTELLRDEGHAVEPFTDVVIALERLKLGARPHVVLLDYWMPKMNADEFLAQLEREGIDVPIMLFTAMNASHVRVPTRNVRAIIRKPFELQHLLEELASVERT
jgi:CheY-like chemotaxis protein